MNLTKEKVLYRQTGSQDAANAVDVNELEEDLGAKPTAKDIKAWLLKNCTPTDMESQLEFPDEATEREKYELLDAWADGWAGRAASIMARR